MDQFIFDLLIKQFSGDSCDRFCSRNIMIFITKHFKSLFIYLLIYLLFHLFIYLFIYFPYIGIISKQRVNVSPPICTLNLYSTCSGGVALSNKYIANRF